MHKVINLFRMALFTCKDILYGSEMQRLPGAARVLPSDAPVLRVVKTGTSARVTGHGANRLALGPQDHADVRHPAVETEQGEVELPAHQEAVREEGEVPPAFVFYPAQVGTAATSCAAKR